LHEHISIKDPIIKTL